MIVADFRIKIFAIVFDLDKKLTLKNEDISSLSLLNRFFALFLQHAVQFRPLQYLLRLCRKEKYLTA
jgi:hypothetical protein